MPKHTDIRIEDISYSYEDFLYRAPLKLGLGIVAAALVGPGS